VKCRKGYAAERLLEELVDSGVYQIAFCLKRSVRRRVGALGELEFAAGLWVYTGSARRALRKRVARHMSRKKTKRWHIDYLLGPGEVVAARAFGCGEVGECAAHGELAAVFEEGPRGFGSSDCSCRSHLVHVGEKGLLPEGFLSILHLRSD